MCFEIAAIFRTMYKQNLLNFWQHFLFGVSSKISSYCSDHQVHRHRTGVSSIPAGGPSSKLKFHFINDEFDISSFIAFEAIFYDG